MAGDQVLSRIPRVFLFRPVWSCVLLGLGFASCGGNDGANGGLEPPPPKGALSVAVSGLPAGAPAQVQVTGPGGFARALTGSELLQDLAPGNYSVSAENVTSAGHTWSPAPASQEVPVAADAEAPASVEYSVSTGALTIAVTGLPPAAPATLTLSGPSGFSQNISATTTITGLVPGTYTLAGGVVSHGTAQYAPAIPVVPAIVPATTPVEVAVGYSRQTGSIALAVTGLPGGVAASLVLAGPGGFAATPTAGGTFADLDPGSYTLTAAPVSNSGNTWTPSSPSQSITVTAGSPAHVSVSYAVTSGRLAVSITGLAVGTAANVTVTGPGGFSQQLLSSQTLTGLVPGTYQIGAVVITSNGNTWTPAPITQQVAVAAGTSATGAVVAYALSSGALTVSLSGLPGGATGSATINGPGGFSQVINSTATLNGLVPGTFTIAAPVVNVAGQPWQPFPATQQVTVTASLTPVAAAVTWSQATGALAIAVSGLPGGTAANLTVTGPGGFTVGVTGSVTLNGIPAGSYTINAANVSGAGQTWAPLPVSQPATVGAGTTANAAVAYAATLGSLTVPVSGLPGGTNANVLVTGPGGYSQAVTATTTLSGLTPGSYTVAASNVSGGGTTYTPAPASQNRTVSAGATATATVTYSSSGGGGGSLNLRIDGLYVTQAAQRYNGTVPLVAGRDGYLRVFALANQANTAQPQVRVRLYSSGTLVQTWTLTAPAASVPLSVNEGSLTASWNILIPASLMQPNLTVLADVDPSNALAETDEGDNTFPVSGTPGPVDVRTLPTFNVRFVPVLQSVNGLQGAVTAGTAPSFLSTLLTLLPVGGYDADVRAAYTTSAPALVSDNANGAWGTILSEVLALKSADASTRYYYGVVKTTYSSGVAGIGYVGGGARTALGWDRLPSGSEVMAHEVGHNMGRNHAPCGGAGGPDPGYPYSGGSIGIWGLDVAALQLKSPSTYFDFMGYCSPDWVSDYNWSAMVTFRQGGPNNSVGLSDRLTVGRGLLVWGRITASGLILEPAFVVDNADLGAPPAGSHRIEARDASGQVIFTTSFAANEAADLPSGREEAFAFVVPAGRALSADIAELRLVSGGRTVSRRPAPVATPAATFTRGVDGRGLLQWDARLHPMVLVRDAASGQILSFARGGSVRLPAALARLDATFSDGTRSARRMINRR